MFFKIAYKTLLIWATFVIKLLPNTLKICTIWSRCLDFKLCNQQISYSLLLFESLNGPFPASFSLSIVV